MVLPVCKELRLLLARCHNQSGGVFRFLFHDVAQRNNLCVGRQQISQQGSTASSCADHCHARLPLLKRNSDHAAPRRVVVGQTKMPSV